MSLLHAPGEETEQPDPAVARVYGRPHGLGSGAVAVEMPVLEVDARRAARLGRETDFDLARFREVRLVALEVRDLPCDDEAARRLPDEDPAPVALRSVGLLAVTSPAGGALDDYHRRLADVMGAWPPAVHVAGEDMERASGLALTVMTLRTGTSAAESSRELTSSSSSAGVARLSV